MKEILEKLKEVERLVEEKSNNCKCANPPTKNKVELSTIEPGERFETELGKMIVLGHDKNSGTTKIIKDDFYGEKVKFDKHSCDYIKSELKKRFDGEITDEYLKVFGDFLVEHEVHLMSVDMQDYGVFNCKVRPITFDEARKFNELLIKKDLPAWWWTCTPWSSEARDWNYSVAVVGPSGYVVDGCDGDFDFGVRPFCILKSNIFVSKVEEQKWKMK